MKEKFLNEYSSEDAINKYSKKTAGDGIEYLLKNLYVPIYLKYIENYIIERKNDKGIRLLEFGCGAGMNLIYLLNELKNKNIKVHSSYGTDFSPALIEAAKKEKELYLQNKSEAKFIVASNENLKNDLSRETGEDKTNLINSFDFIFGINTFRYCHRLKKQDECAKNIYELLVAGGICIIVDMNSKFPIFRSTIKDRLIKSKEEYFLPSLGDYVNVFQNAGFKVLEMKNFCWIPHSSKGVELKIMIMLAPILDIIFPNYAMRSIVVSRKPIM